MKVHLRSLVAMLALTTSSFAAQPAPVTGSAPAPTPAPTATLSDSTVYSRVTNLATNKSYDIPVSRLDSRQKNLPPQLRDAPAEAARAVVAESEEITTILQEKALEAGIDKTPAYQANLAQAQTGALVSTLVDQEATKKITKAEKDKAFEEFNRIAPKDMQDIRLKHASFKTKDAAIKFLNEVTKKGHDFDKALAEIKKIDDTAEGGQLDYTNENAFPADIRPIIKSTANASWTKAPVQIGDRYAVFRIEDKRKAALPTFEQAEPSLVEILKQKFAMEYINDIRKGYKIERMDPKTGKLEPVVITPDAPAAPAVAPQAPAVAAQ